MSVMGLFRALMQSLSKQDPCINQPQLRFLLLWVADLAFAISSMDKNF